MGPYTQLSIPISMPSSPANSATRNRPSPLSRSKRAEAAADLFQVPKENEAARTRKLGELTAYAIKRDIAARGWPVGEVLGNQVELMRHYNVSRSTLREAVRQIERHGVARMRRGVGGGLVVQQPARDSVVLAIASYLELAAISLTELFEAREVIEGLLVGLICERATDTDLKRLGEMLQELLGSAADDMQLEATRHLALRRAINSLSRNAALSLLLESLYCVTSDMLTVEADHPDVKMLIRESRREKAELVEALLGGDEMQARMSMRAALERGRKQAEQQLRRMRIRFEDASALTLGVTHDSPSAGNAAMKLGHRTSLRIAHDIAAAKSPPGTRIGAEPEVGARYGVSRAVFREAVRTLELHSIVGVRRGLGGGLVVGTPDPAYTVELTSIYFQYARLKPRHFYELWRTIQTTAAQLAARNIDAAGRRQLVLLLEQQQQASRENMLEIHGRVHGAVSVLSGNRVLALFTQVMAEIAAYYSTRVPSPEIWKVFTDSHTELVGAISRGEVALARRLMTRHLKLVDAWYGETPRSEWLQSLRETEEPLPELSAAPKAAARKKTARKPPAAKKIAGRKPAAKKAVAKKRSKS
jgi:DNA-binding FadR family transcriptional regulator